jgi:aldehyde dehydrogenase (NAD+)
VQENVADRLVAKLRARMETLRVGDPLDKAIDVGAIIAPVQLEKIERLVARGRAEGATMWQPSWACPAEGYFFPPTLFTDVAPASTIAQVEIFGPVLATMTFRTTAEAVALANNTPYGLAASVWSENINRALDVARAIKAGTVWVNCTNVFDAASGFGGYRESGFGREGAIEGLYEYVKPMWEVRSQEPGMIVEGTVVSVGYGNALPAARDSGHGDEASHDMPQAAEASASERRLDGRDGSTDSHTLVTPYPPIDRTPKMFIGGQQVRPDSGYSRAVVAPDGRIVGEVGAGNRKDVRNAVEAAHVAAGWAASTAHARAQILYYVAENLSARGDEFARRLETMTGRAADNCSAEVGMTIERLFTYAAWADKFDGRVHATPLRGVTLALPEPTGVMGVVCDDAYPLLQFVSLVAPAIAMGNTVVAVPSERYPLSATDLYQVLETSEVPPGVVNIVTGERDALARVLAEHDDVDAVWYAGSADGAAMVERASAGNLKRTWILNRPPRDWMDHEQGQGTEFLREATQVKNIWAPSGD